MWHGWAAMHLSEGNGPQMSKGMGTVRDYEVYNAQIAEVLAV
jgi:hypothetical protein